MTEPIHELEAYFAGNADDEQLRAVEAWIQADPAHAKAFMEQLYFRELVGQHLRERRSETGAVLTELAMLEAQVEADTITLLGELPTTQQKTRVSAHDFAEVGQYLFEHALANKRVLYAAGSALAAAVVLIAAILWLPFGHPAPEPALTDLDRLNPLPTPTYRPVVATLTDAVGAQWRSDDKPVPMPMGAQLVAFERFTLTHGFAEITTRRGAVALIQAPATIELTDSDNAIRLHQGKLVGKCETPASKGFIVHAPDMDVVDLGTEFGVEADVKHGSTVLVMTGEVRAQPTERSPLAFTPVVLRKDQARQIVPETGGLGMIAASEAPVFYEESPHPYVAAVLDASPVAYWRFEDYTNKTITNEIDSRNGQLSVVGPATLTDAGVIGKAARLVNQAVPYGYFETTSEIKSLDLQGTFTVELWYYTDQGYTLDTAVAALISQLYADEQLKQPFAIQLENDERQLGKGAPIGWRPSSIRVTPAFIKDGPTPRDFYTPDTYPIRKWQHIVLVNDRDHTRLYRDGVLVEDIPYPIQSPGQTRFRLGLSSGDLAHGPESKTDIGVMRPLRGRLDEVALYDKPLTAEQVARHHALATGGAASP